MKQKFTLQEHIHSKHNEIIVDGWCGKSVIAVGNGGRGELMTGNLWRPNYNNILWFQG